MMTFSARSGARAGFGAGRWHHLGALALAFGLLGCGEPPAPPQQQELTVPAACAAAATCIAESCPCRPDKPREVCDLCRSRAADTVCADVSASCKKALEPPQHAE